MKRNLTLRLACLFLVLGPLLSAQPVEIYSISKDIPTATKYEDFKKLVQTIKAESEQRYLTFDVNVFDVLLKANRNNEVLWLAKAYHEYWPEGDFACPVKSGSVELVENPVNLAYRLGRDEVVRGLLEIEPALVNLRGRVHVYFLLPPLAEAVKKADTAWVREFLVRGAKVDVVVAPEGLPMNLLSISPTPEIDQILLDHHVETVGTWDEPFPSRCLDNHVRLRKDPSTTSAVLAQINKDEPLQILGYTFKVFTIGTQSGRWMHVNYQGTVGWVFQAFVALPDWE